MVGVEPHLLKDRGVEVLDVEPVGDRAPASSSVCPTLTPAFDPAACHPHGEAIGVVVAAGARGVLGGRLPAELAAPDHQRLVQQAAMLEVLKQPGDRLVGAAGVIGVILNQVAMGVPIVVIVRSAGIQLHEADSPLDQPSGEQAAAAEVRGLLVVDAVEGLRVVGLARVVDGLGSVLLHLEGQLIAGDPGGQVAVAGALGEWWSALKSRRASSSWRCSSSRHALRADLRSSTGAPCERSMVP